MQEIKKKWNIKSKRQLIVILVVFAITGSTSAWVSKPILQFFEISVQNNGLLIYILAYVFIIFPVYQILLLLIGYLLGQFAFFWEFEKKMLSKIGFSFLFKQKKK
jgi:hypothetical protein